MKKLVPFLVALFLAAPAWATTRSVTKAGADSGNCSVSACLTIAYAATQMAAADTLTIGAGTYNEGLTYNEFPAGADDSNHTIVTAAPPALVIINGHESNNFTASIADAYKTFSNLTFDAVNASNGVAIFLWGTAPNKAHHILLQGVEVKNVSGGTSACITAGGDGTDVHHITMSHLNVHDCTGGTPTTHGIYLHMNDSTVQDSTIHGVSGYGIQQYSNVAVALSNNTIQRNIIYDVARDGTGYGGLYLGQTNSDNTRVLNNVMYNGGGPGSCIQEQGTLNTLIYNNTCADFAAAGGVSGFIREGTSGVDTGSIAKNNIGWGNTPLNTIFGSAWTQSNNICGSGCASSSNPLFVNAATGNFHIPSVSPAAGLGLDLSAIFTTDFDGKTRTVPWSAGAFVANVPPSQYRGFFTLF